MAWTTVFMDGFDHYATADILGKWNNSQSNPIIDSSQFRNSGQALRTGGANTIGVSKAIGQTRNVCLGFGFRAQAITSASTLASQGGGLMGLTTALTMNTNSGQVGLGWLNDGKLRAVRGHFAASTFNSPTELGVASTVLSAATWYYIELRVFIDDTAGQFELRINGVSEINLSGIDTQMSTDNFVSSLLLMGGDGSTNRWYDDLYVRTSSASTAEAGGFLGDIKVKPFYPNADGTYSQMTPSTGTTHNTLVDEALAGTTDYVSSSTAGHKDSYGFQDLSETGSIKAVQLNVYATKDDAGFRAIDLFTKSGATEDFDSAQTLSTTGTYKYKVWENDPNTGSSWSQSNLNSAEFGVRISSGS